MAVLLLANLVVWPQPTDRGWHRPRSAAASAAVAAELELPYWWSPPRPDTWADFNPASGSLVLEID